MKAVVIMLSFLLSACANYAAEHALAERNLRHFLGQPVQAAVDVLGAPDVIKLLPKGKAYKWDNLPAYANDVRKASPDFDANAISPPHCTIFLITVDDIVVKGGIRGDVGGCRKYDEKLNDRYASYPNGRWINRAYYSN